MTAQKHILLLLDGEEPSSAQLQTLVSTSDFVAACDGAAEYARRNGVDLDAIIGDMDSISDDTKEYYHSQQTRLIQVAEQETNDFEKALLYLKQQYNGASLTVLGIHGKRTDHLFMNFSVMCHYANDFSPFEAIDAYHTHLFLTDIQKSITITRPKDTLVSLLAFAPVVGITTTGLHYELNDSKMEFGKREGLSNFISSDKGAKVSIESGALLVSIAHER